MPLIAFSVYTLLIITCMHTVLTQRFAFREQDMPWAMASLTMGRLKSLLIKWANLF